MFAERKTFTKDNLNEYLKALSVEFRKRNGTKMRAELILVGGAAVLTNYGFRDSTSDIDAIVLASSAMKDAIRAVADNEDLPFDWLNTDFRKTTSFSQKLVMFSSPYKTFSNILDVRTVRAEYLLAMKLVAARDYKNDLSDIVGILMEQAEKDAPIAFEKVDSAMKNLYGGWGRVDDNTVQFLNAALAATNLRELYEKVRNDEILARDAIVEFDKAHRGELTKERIKELVAKRKKQGVQKTEFDER